MTIQKFIDRMKLKGITQEHIANRLRISQAQVSNYAKGQHIPTLKTAIRIYDVYRIAVYPYCEEGLKYYKQRLLRT